MFHKCIVMGAGELKIQQPPDTGAALVIAVDGGFTYCRRLGISPDFIVGDFDSVDSDGRQGIRAIRHQRQGCIVELSPEKDDTDMLAALKLGLEQGCREFYIYGGMGGRLDHALANIQCLLYLKNHGAVGYLIHGRETVQALQNESVYFQKGMRGTMSLFSLGRYAKGVTIRGMKYPLNDYTMSNDFPIGISNEFSGEEAFVEVAEGELVCIVSLQ